MLNNELGKTAQLLTAPLLPVKKKKKNNAVGKKNTPEPSINVQWKTGSIP